MIGIIACVSRNGIIGKDGKLALSYPEDMKHFRTTTKGCTVIMGRKTFEDIGKPLPNRQNIVVSTKLQSISGIEVASSLLDAFSKADPNKDVWICGGYSIYEDGMNYADKILLTITPDVLNDSTIKYTKFPWINPNIFLLKSIKQLGDEEELLHEPDPNSLLLATYVKNKFF